MKNQKFYIVKNKNSDEIAYYEYDETLGYNIKPKNNNKTNLRIYGTEE